MDNVTALLIASLRDTLQAVQRAQNIKDAQASADAMSDADVLIQVGIEQANAALVAKDNV